MKYYTSTTEFNCGIDLHARQMYVCLMDRQGKKLVHTHVKDNDFAYFLKLVEPYQHSLTVSCECMFGWYALLQSVPGIAENLGLTILYEIGDIERFPTVKDFLSYCRLVKGTVASAGKIKGLRGAKLGNPYLRWAFGEAAVINKRDHFRIRPLAQRLEARMAGNKFKANTVLAIKLARSVYFMLKGTEPGRHPPTPSRFAATAPIHENFLNAGFFVVRKRIAHLRFSWVSTA